MQKIFWRLAVAMFAAVVGSVAAALVSYSLYPAQQYEYSIFVADLFSPGSFASAAFAWLFYFPAFSALMLIIKRLMRIDVRDQPFWLWAGASFLLIFIVKLHIFASVSNGVLEYSLNSSVIILIIFAVSIVSSGRERASRSE